MMFRKWMLAVCLGPFFLFSHAWASTDSTNPSALQTPVQYPSSAVSTGEQGNVLIKAKVDTRGRVIDATIEKSSGYADLDAAALSSVANWSFTPGTTDGNAETRWVLLPVYFQLKAESRNELTSRRYVSAMAGSFVWFLGTLIWIVGFMWSVVLAKRKSIYWLSGMVALWLITYPVFVARHWTAARKNLAVIAIGITLMGAGLLLQKKTV